MTAQTARFCSGQKRERKKRELYALIPYVSHDGADGSVLELPRTRACEVPFTLAAESLSIANAAFSQTLLCSLP
jgi:hypothetical protein